MKKSGIICALLMLLFGGLAQGHPKPENSVLNIPSGSTLTLKEDVFFLPRSLRSTEDIVTAETDGERNEVRVLCNLIAAEKSQKLRVLRGKQQLTIKDVQVNETEFDSFRIEFEESNISHLNCFVQVWLPMSGWRLPYSKNKSTQANIKYFEEAIAEHFEFEMSAPVSL